jgi:hypothetical protein
MELQEQIRALKAEFRSAMNGMASTSMRQKGVNYKVNFGIELPRLKEIASHYPKEHALAQALWQEQVRESKIVAGLLQPVESFIPELADVWMEEMERMNIPELAELTCMNLFQYLPYASVKAFEWVADERPYFQACGFLVLARLFGRGLKINERSENEYLDQVAAALLSEASFPQRCAYHSLLKYIGQGAAQGEKALKALQPLKESRCEEVRALYEEVHEEVRNR